MYFGGLLHALVATNDVVLLDFVTSNGNQMLKQEQWLNLHAKIKERQMELATKSMLTWRTTEYWMNEDRRLKIEIPSQWDPNNLGCLQNLLFSNQFHPIHTPKTKWRRCDVNIDKNSDWGEDFRNSNKSAHVETTWYVQ